MLQNAVTSQPRLNLSLQGVLTDTISAYAFGGVQRGNYQDRNTLFELTRHDTLYSAGGGISGPRVSWRLATSFPPSLDLLHGAGVRVAQRVEELVFV